MSHTLTIMFYLALANVTCLQIGHGKKNFDFATDLGDWIHIHGYISLIHSIPTPATCLSSNSVWSITEMLISLQLCSEHLWLGKLSSNTIQMEYYVMCIFILACIITLYIFLQNLVLFPLCIYYTIIYIADLQIPLSK